MAHLELQLFEKYLYIKMIEFESDISEIKAARRTGKDLDSVYSVTSNETEQQLKLQHCNKKSVGRGFELLSQGY